MSTAGFACAHPTGPAVDEAVLAIDCSTAIHAVDGVEIAGKRGRSCAPVYLSEGQHRVGFKVEKKVSSGRFRTTHTVACHSRVRVRAGDRYTVLSEYRDRAAPGKLSLMPDFDAWLESDSTGKEVGVTVCDNPAAGNRFTSCSISSDFPKPDGFRAPGFPQREFMSGRSGTLRFTASVKRDGSIRRVRSLVATPEPSAGPMPERRSRSSGASVPKTSRKSTFRSSPVSAISGTPPASPSRHASGCFGSGCELDEGQGGSS